MVCSWIYDPQTGARYLGHGEIEDSMNDVVIGKALRSWPLITRIDNAQVNVPFIQKIIRGYRGI